MVPYKEGKDENEDSDSEDDDGNQFEIDDGSGDIGGGEMDEAPSASESHATATHLSFAEYADSGEASSPFSPAAVLTARMHSLEKNATKSCVRLPEWQPTFEQQIPFTYSPRPNNDCEEFFIHGSCPKESCSLLHSRTIAAKRAYCFRYAEVRKCDDPACEKRHTSIKTVLAELADKDAAEKANPPTRKRSGGNSSSRSRRSPRRSSSRSYDNVPNKRKADNDARSPRKTKSNSKKRPIVKKAKRSESKYHLVCDRCGPHKFHSTEDCLHLKRNNRYQ